MCKRGAACIWGSSRASRLGGFSGDSRTSWGGSRFSLRGCNVGFRNMEEKEKEGVGPATFPNYSKGWWRSAQCKRTIPDDNTNHFLPYAWPLEEVMSEEGKKEDVIFGIQVLPAYQQLAV